MHKMTVATLAGVVTSVSVVGVLKRERIAQLLRKIRNDIAMTNLNMQYAVRITEIDVNADLLSTAFFTKHRTYFNKLADFHEPVVQRRGAYLLSARRACRCIISYLILCDLARQHVAELEKIDPKSAQPFASAYEKINEDAEQFFASMKRTEIPVTMIRFEYNAMA